MLCYKDRSYCNASELCGNESCGYRISEAERNRAGELDLPIAYALLRDCDHYCPGFVELEATE